jgi:hypothetical protein
MPLARSLPKKPTGFEALGILHSFTSELKDKPHSPLLEKSIDLKRLPIK